MLIDLHLKRTAPTLKFLSSRSQLGKNSGKYFGWLPIIPNGIISGTLNYKGNVKRISGSGYHDHSWSNVSGKELQNYISYWYWARAQAHDYSILISYLVPKNQNDIRSHNTVYLLKSNKIIKADNSNLTVYQNNKITSPDTSGRIFGNVDFVYKNPDLETRLSLDRINNMLLLNNSKAKNQVGWDYATKPTYFENGIYYRNSGTGSLEVVSDGKKEILKAGAIWEFLNFQDNLENR